MTIGKYLIGTGIFLIILGLLWILGAKPGLEKLPGDIVVKKEQFSFYFPLVTCLIISVALTLLFQLLRWRYK